MDDGSYRSFPAYRVQHSSVLGPTKGGIRYDDGRRSRRVRGARDVDDVEVRAAAAALRRREGRRALQRARAVAERVTRITRRFTAELAPFIGPQLDIPAPDMATNEQTMAWMMDTYSMQKGYAVPEIVTGKPISIGGSVFRHEATGAGVVMVIERACARLGWDSPAALRRAGLRQRRRHRRDRAARQGRARRRRLRHLRRRLLARWLDIPTLHAYVAQHGSLEGYTKDVERITNEELLELECDILVLAAREDQVTGENAAKLRCKLVAEGANGPTSIEGDRILAERGIPVLPDILTNAGGVTVSYFEWVQDLGRLFWDHDEIRRRLADKMSDAFDRVWNVSQERGISLRDAALVAAIREVSAALEARGVYP